ncbi:succinate dehydrogenase assembly factor 2 [Commensalibacter oyaizuii]|uniref:FAD assembly factor SdhE n=1 Tax=Commensalibacter oyaizuii TaxID=3043873 RepID=A0ABT6Q046_9PROT|nr:succinate dehydrogenase assembly factor 2 [Commensalibacter sp. TBRC 16381]MDI2090478.1 succinate dehydrogenase assembly factor 2 [Commensalibacter sp. TBRC 16381]
MSPLEIRKRRILYQANHRGTFEADLLIGSFAKYYIDHMNEQDLDELERIMTFEDADLTLWLTGFKSIPADVNSPMVQQMVQFAKTIHSNNNK